MEQLSFVVFLQRNASNLKEGCGSMKRRCRGYLEIESILFAVADERAELTRVHVVVQVQQEPLAELEGGRMSSRQLPDAIDQLRENGRRLLLVALQVTAPIGEFVAERQPVLLDQSLQTLKRPVVRVHQHLGQRTHLGSSVPACRINSGSIRRAKSADRKLN